MTAIPQVFVDIDTQRDFLDPAGALYVPGSTEILDNLARLTRFAREHAIPIIATACAHSPDDPELKTFPPHCIRGTSGMERVEATAISTSAVIDDDSDLPESISPHVTLLKREYDVFSHPRANALLEQYRDSDPVFVVYGVATDYCVKAAVDGFLKRGFRTALVVDAIRPIDASAEEQILTDFARRGVLLTLTDVVCNSRSLQTLMRPAS